MKFIRKGGRIIPIRDKGESEKIAKGHDKVAKMKDAEASRSNKKAYIGAGAGALAGLAVAKKFGKGKLTSSIVGAGIGAVASRLFGAKNSEVAREKASEHREAAIFLRKKKNK